MLYAAAHPEPEKGGRGKRAGDRRVSHQRIAEARALLRDGPDLVDGVIAGTPTLSGPGSRAARRAAPPPRRSARVRHLEQDRRTRH
jgi:hypothetical protein